MRRKGICNGLGPRCRDIERDGEGCAELALLSRPGQRNAGMECPWTCDSRVAILGVRIEVLMLGHKVGVCGQARRGSRLKKRCDYVRLQELKAQGRDVTTFQSKNSSYQWP